jgi:hypothetical protein
MHRRKLTKLLGLATLAIAAVMAMNASAAQAIYTLDGGTTHGNGTLLLKLELNLLLSEFLLAGLSTHFHCSGGAGSMLLETNSAMTTLSGSGTIAIKGCKVGWYPGCTVNTPGAAAGEILVSLSGEAAMAESTTFMNIGSAELTAWIYEGATCPFHEMEGMVNGEVVWSLPSGETLAESKLSTLDDIQLFYGEEELSFHGTNLATPVALHAAKAGGGTWAVQLTAL